MLKNGRQSSLQSYRKKKCDVQSFIQVNFNQVNFEIKQNVLFLPSMNNLLDTAIEYLHGVGPLKADMLKK